jgi:hypothetical protein
VLGKSLSSLKPSIRRNWGDHHTGVGRIEGVALADLDVPQAIAEQFAHQLEAFQAACQQGFLVQAVVDVEQRAGDAQGVPKRRVVPRARNQR